MKWKVAFSILALSIATQASADEHRGGDAALGALSGAVVLGPIGAVAGAVVGYTAGASIAHSWGFRRLSAARHTTKPARQQARHPSPANRSPPNNQVPTSTVASGAAEAPAPVQATAPAPA